MKKTIKRGWTKMLWFLLGLVAGGVLGMMLLALMVAAKEADKSFVIPKQQATTGECFWCGECMLETSNDEYVCPACGWIYKHSCNELFGL